MLDVSQYRFPLADSESSETKDSPHHSKVPSSCIELSDPERFFVLDRLDRESTPLVGSLPIRDFAVEVPPTLRAFRLDSAVAEHRELYHEVAENVPKSIGPDAFRIGPAAKTRALLLVPGESVEAVALVLATGHYVTHEAQHALQVLFNNELDFDVNYASVFALLQENWMFLAPRLDRIPPDEVSFESIKARIANRDRVKPGAVFADAVDLLPRSLLARSAIGIALIDERKSEMIALNTIPASQAGNEASWSAFTRLIDSLESLSRHYS